MEQLNETITGIVIKHGPSFVGALLVLIIGWQIIRWLSSWFGKVLDKRSTDESLKPFFKSMLSVVLKVLLVISVMGMAGIQMTSFIAILGAAGLAVGLALSGTLQNFAGGVVILTFKPFKVGDFITAQGYSGTVEEIQIFVTLLKTPQNVVIVIPNSELSNSSLTNFSVKPVRRADWSFGIGYGESFDKAKKVLLDIIEKDDRILKDPEPFIALGEMADSSVNITVRAWAKSADFWSVFFDMNEKVYKTFNQEGINIPFPQMDVHLHKVEGEN